MGRGRKEQPPDTGLSGFREPGEAVDDRPKISRDRIWNSDGEELEYTLAVQQNPIRVGEGVMSYARRIALIVEPHASAYRPASKVLRPMPRAWMSKRKQDERLSDLREQGKDYWNE